MTCHNRDARTDNVSLTTYLTDGTDDCRPAKPIHTGQKIYSRSRLSNELTTQRFLTLSCFVDFALGVAFATRYEIEILPQWDEVAWDNSHGSPPSN